MRGPHFSGTRTVEQELEPIDTTERRHAAFDNAFAAGATIAVAANASRSLVDALKSSGRRPVFVPLDPWGAPVPSSVDGVIVGSISGQVPPIETSLPVVVDAGDDHLPTTGRLSIDFDSLRQVHHDIAVGVRAAAGFDTLPGQSVGNSPATGVVVRLPEGADPTTFYAYARGEGTGIEWVALRQPLHPQAFVHLTTTDLERSSRNLTHLFHLPIGDQFRTEEIDHAVLGVVKAAEYLGWRWWQDPDLVEDYSNFLNDKYGPDHDAYRPAFEHVRSRGAQ